MSETRHIPWANAGGPDECAHGYAAGVPCPTCPPMTTRDTPASAETIAQEIVDDLFTSGTGARADRLVMESGPDREDIGGWSDYGARLRILDILNRRGIR